ncbi:MAG: GNAT family N-acetyltransferase [Anaerolineales bacterium]|nr:GNAT family N-acetyltransferase [Anaerolineales bacterium]
MEKKTPYPKRSSKLSFHPLTPERWEDFVKLFGKDGAYGGCWCMWWRESRAEFARKQGAGNRRAMHRIVFSGEIPGILAYAAGEVAGWISVAPREDFPALERSRTLKRIDSQPVWSIVCFFVAPEHRGKGIAVPLIRVAAAYAKRREAKIVEAYPTAPKGGELAPVSAYMGVPSMFRRAGFVECARPTERKRVMRLILRGS